MKAIVTGSAGFVAPYLIKALTERGDTQVIGLDRGMIDLTNSKDVDRIIGQEKPDYVYHLAAHAFVPTSFASPQEVFENNVRSTQNILEAVRRFSPHTKVLIAGSSEEYGLVTPEQCPINEQTPLRPQSTYAVSKVACDFLGMQYRDTWGLHVVLTRAFNHTGPGRPDLYAESTFAKQIARVEKGKQGMVWVGNLDAVRDYTDVRDMVEAYILAIDLAPDVYVIASGKGYQMKTDVLHGLLSLSNETIKWGYDGNRMRPSDVPLLVGDSSKFRKLTGWEPKISFDQTLKDILDYWRPLV